MPDQTLRRTPLYAMHVRLGGRMVPFAGYEMPVQYPAGILKEHQHTRGAAGLFDVSHMGQIALRPRAGGVDTAARALETLVPADIVGLAAGRQRYTLFTNTLGGVLDDLMVSNQGDHLLLIVNAACKEDDEAHLRAHLSGTCNIELLTGRALVALQGPKAEAALAALAPAVGAMRFMDARAVPLLGDACMVSRSGYTGEDGFEIGIAAEQAEALCAALLKNESVAPVGLGARDSLRLEAGLCLYGSDLTPEITPIEAALEWAISPARRSGGARAGGFPGASVILGQLANGTERRRVGLRAEGRQPVRGGAALFSSPEGGEAIGFVTSGAFGPTINSPMAMGYVPTPLSSVGTTVYADVRGKRIATTVTPLPFVPHHYRRG